MLCDLPKSRGRMRRSSSRSAIGGHCTGRGPRGAEDTVLILGAGTSIGAIILQTRKAKGVKTVICCDINDSSLERASKRVRRGLCDQHQNEDLGFPARAGYHWADMVWTSSALIRHASQCSLTSLFAPRYHGERRQQPALAGRAAPEQISSAMLLDQRELDLIGVRMSAYQFEPTIERFEQHAVQSGEITSILSLQFSRYRAALDKIGSIPTVG